MRSRSLTGIRTTGFVAGALAFLVGCTPPGALDTPDEPAPSPPHSSTFASTPSVPNSPATSSSEEPNESSSASDSPTPEVSSPSVVPQVTASPSPSEAASAIEVAIQISRVGWDAEAGRLVGAAVVPGIVESGGTCTVFALRSGASVSLGYSALADAASTICPEWSLDDDKLTSGLWKVHVEYDSPSSSGTSDVVDVTIP